MTLPAGIIKAEGRIEATQIDVPSKYAGELVEVAVQEGDKVAAGQVIATMSSPELEAQLQATQLKLRSAQEARAEDAIKAAEAQVEQIKSMIGDLRLVSPREGKVQYQLARAGDHVPAGALIVTLIDLADVYMTVFIRAADAEKLGLGDEARLILDAAPDYVIPATVGFVASNPQSASNALADQGGDRQADASGRSEGRSECFARILCKGGDRVARRGIRAHEARREMARRLTSQAASCAGRPDDSARSCARRARARVHLRAYSRTFHRIRARCCAGVPASSCAGCHARGHAHALFYFPPAPAPAAEASTSAPVAREAEPIPPPPPVPASPPAPARSPAAKASMSAGLGQKEPVAGVAPESLAQLSGAWAESKDDCKKLFQRRGSALTYRQPVDQLAQAVIIELQRIRLPKGVCRLERASHEGGALKVSGECQDLISYTSQTAYVKLRSQDQIVFNPNGDPALNISMIRCAL